MAAYTIEENTLPGAYPLEEEVEAPVELPKWNEKDARSRARSVSVASGKFDPSLEDQIAMEYMTRGESQLAKNLVTEMKAKHQAMVVGAVAENVGFLGLRESMIAMEEALVSGPHPDDIIDDNNTLLLASAAAETEGPFSDETLDAFLGKERQLTNELMQWRQEDSEMFQGGWVKGVVDFVGAMVPGNAQNSWRKLTNALEEQGYDVDATTGSWIATGERMDTVRDWWTGLSSEERASIYPSLREMVRESSGFFGDNDVLAFSMLEELTGEAEGRFVEGFADADRIVNNLVAVLDTVAIGQGVKAAYKGASSVINKSSNMAKAERIAPREAVDMEATILAANDTRGAASMGTSPEEIVADKLLPKWEGYNDNPIVSETFIQEQVELSKRVLGQAAGEIDLHMLPEEKMLQANKLKETLDNTKGGKIWGNASKVTQEETGVTYTGRYGKDDVRGFTDVEAEEFVTKLKTQLGDEVEISVVAKQYDNSVEAVKTTVKSTTPARTVDDVAAELKEKLTLEAGGKLPRGATAAGKAKGAELRDIQRRLKEAKEALRAIRNPKSNVSKAIKAKVNARLDEIRAKSPKSALDKTIRGKIEKEYLDEINNLENITVNASNAERANAKAIEAEANLSRLEQGQYDKLTGEAKAFWKKNTKGLSKTTEEVVEEIPNPRPTEYFVDVKYFDKYRVGSGNASLAGWADMILGNGSRARYLFDITHGLSRQLSDSFYRAFDKSRGTEKAILSILEPFTTASNAAKKKIVKLLDEGSTFQNADGTIGKNFTANEVIERLPTDISAKEAREVVEGYLSVRHMADVSHSIMNNKMREKLLAEGMKHISSENWQGVAKPLSADTMLDVKTFFNPTTGEFMEDVTRAQMKELQEKGYSIYKSNDLQGTGNKRTHYILVDGEGTTVNQLPMNVMSYREGYIPRIYKEQYFITVRPNVAYIDGKKVTDVKDIPTRTIGVAKSRAEAAKMLEKVNDNADGLVYDWKHAREITNDDTLLAMEVDLHGTNGGMFYSKRNAHLSDTTQSLADIEDPVTSIARMASSVARQVDLAPVIQLHKQRWINQFGHMTQGKFPTASSLIGKTTRISDEEIKKAKAYWGYIDLQESSASTQDWWRSMSVRWGEWLEDRGMNKLGSVFRNNVSEYDPFSALRGATFITSIVMNPLRQMFLQSQQFLFLSGIDPQYVSTGKGLIAPFVLRYADDDALKKAAKYLDVTPEEAVAIKRSIEESGLMEAVDSHLIGRDAMMLSKVEITESLAQAMVQKGQNALVNSIGTVRRWGFDEGEMINIINTYMIAYRKHLKQFPDIDPFSRRGKYMIATDARQLALGMTQAGSLGYQRTVWSVPLQFVSVQQKAMMALWKGLNGGSELFTASQARKVFAGQVLLYGAQGVGIATAIDYMLKEANLEVSPEVRNYLAGGLYDFTANTLLNAIGNMKGEDWSKTNLNFSGTLAAGGGWADTLVDKLADFQEVSMLEMFAGPSSTPLSRFGNALSITSSILGARVLGVTEEITPDRAIQMLDAWASIASGYNNIARGWAMNQADTFLDKNFNSMPLESTRKDAAMRAAFGITSHEEEGYYNHVMTMGEKKAKLEKLADVYAGRVSRILGMDEQQAIPSFNQTLRALQDEYKYIEFAYGAEDARQIALLMEQKIKIKADNGYGRRLLNQVAKIAMDGSAGSSYDEVMTNLVNRGLIKSEDKATFDRFYKPMFEVSE